MTRVFINYRRGDSIATAGRLHDRLASALGRNNMFMDVDHIPAGVDFVQHLDRQVRACDVFLALIGRSWLTAADEHGRRRIDDPGDFVAIEIEAALARDIPVIPVLIDGAVMPREAELPERIRPLTRRHAVEIRNSQFSSDVDRLIAKVDPRAAGAGGRRSGLALAVVALAVVAAGAWGAFKYGGLAVPWPPPVTDQPALAPAASYCSQLKEVLASTDRRFDPILGPLLGRNRVALVALPDWEDCAVIMETKFSNKRRYSCSRAGFADLSTAEQMTETIASGIKAGCLGDSWTLSRFFSTDGKRSARLADETSHTTVTLTPTRLATAPSWSVDLEIE